MGLILFNLALPVVASMGYATPSGAEIPTHFSEIAAWDWRGLVAKGIVMFVVGAIAVIVGFKLSVGAMVFAVVFTVSTLPFGATLNWLHISYDLPLSVVGDPMPGTLAISGHFGIMLTAMYFVFLYGFIQLASAVTERD